MNFFRYLLGTPKPDEKEAKKPPPPPLQPNASMLGRTSTQSKQAKKSKSSELKDSNEKVRPPSGTATPPGASSGTTTTTPVSTPVTSTPTSADSPAAAPTPKSKFKTVVEEEEPTDFEKVAVPSRPAQSRGSSPGAKQKKKKKADPETMVELDKTTVEQDGANTIDEHNKADAKDDGHKKTDHKEGGQKKKDGPDAPKD